MTTIELFNHQDELIETIVIFDLPEMNNEIEECIIDHVIENDFPISVDDICHYKIKEEE